MTDVIRKALGAFVDWPNGNPQAVPLAALDRLEARVHSLERALWEAQEFIEAARPLLGMSAVNSLGARADRLYATIRAARAVVLEGQGRE